ncbi:hypothetical protein [Agromyces sp. C10]|uniref:hypothetical protein n=1 Tax=Agromyces sp. C10 TaxID=2935077 RepID=UPI00200B58A6|nr:hypothetical protein [Agromyces sp. C10]MCK8608886.1 hypothetical protein [Agromyces sp. C10]
MPTGPKHIRSYDLLHPDGREEHIEEPCRCTIGDDHDASDALSPWEAEDIYMSSGMDEDYDFR